MLLIALTCNVAHRRLIRQATHERGLLANPKLPSRTAAHGLLDLDIEFLKSGFLFKVPFIAFLGDDLDFGELWPWQALIEAGEQAVQVGIKVFDKVLRALSEV